MHDTIFRMYDIRGKVGIELLIPQTYDLIRALAVYLVEKQPMLKTVVVGMDGRTHSPLIKDEVCRALLDSGLDVIFLGVCHSPLMYFSLRSLPVDAGIMITASHNPKEYNGFKICLGTESLWGEAFQEIKQLYKQKVSLFAPARGVYREESIIPHYVRYLAQCFPQLVGMSSSMIFDCGNGATGVVIPELIETMQWKKARVLCAEVDGTYPNHDADPVVDENMRDVKQVLQETDAVVGIGFDGDGDRMAAMTKQGYLVAGDQMLALLSAAHIRQYPGAAIVCDIKSSSVLLDVIEQQGGRAVLSPSGHSLIKRAMKQCDAKIGGELSGHFFFSDYYFGYDDGVYAALRLLSLLQEQQTTLHDLVNRLPVKVSSPEFRLACDEDKKHEIISAVRTTLALRSDVQLNIIDGVRATFPIGMGILRASNTQPVLSMRFEADTRHDLQELKEVFIKAMAPYLDESLLQKELMERRGGSGT